MFLSPVGGIKQQSHLFHLLLCASARRVGTQLGRFVICVGGAMVRGEEASAIWGVLAMCLALRTRAGWMEACFETPTI